MKLRTVRIHDLEGSWTDVERVRQTGTYEGMYHVHTAMGEVFRFPLSLVRMVVESPAKKEGAAAPTPFIRECCGQRFNTAAAWQEHKAIFH